MRPRQKKIAREWENEVAAGAAPPPAPHTQRKRVLGRGCMSNTVKSVCCHCDREFRNGRALGGHIRIHNRENGGDSSSRTDPNVSDKAATARAARAERARARARRLNSNDRESGGDAGDNNDSNNGVVDLSQNLSEFGWKVHKKRGSNSDNNQEIVVICECMEDQVWDDGDDDGHSNVSEMLQRVGISSTAHPIIIKRRMFLCTVCNQYIRTFHGVCCHLNEVHSSADNAAHGYDQQQQPREREEEEEEVEKDDEGGEEIEAAEEEQDHEDEPEEGEQDPNANDSGEDEDDENEGGDGEEEGPEKSMEVEKESGVGEDGAVVEAEEGTVMEGAEAVTMEAGEAAAEQGAGAGTSDARANICTPINQNVEASDPPRRRNFDLNDLPPLEEKDD